MWSRDPSQSQPQPLAHSPREMAPKRGKADLWERLLPVLWCRPSVTLVCLPGRDNAAAGHPAAAGLSSALHHHPGLHLDEAPLSLQKAG